MFKKNIFKNNNIIVTGGAGGIGSATCKLFLEYGANVFLVDKDKMKINNIKREINNLKLKTFNLDITSEKEVKNFDFVDIETLNVYLDDQKRILPRRVTELSIRNQRRLTKAVKRARLLGLLPFTVQAEY